MPVPGGFGPWGPDRKSRPEPAASEDGDPVLGPVIQAARKLPYVRTGVREGQVQGRWKARVFPSHEVLNPQLLQFDDRRHGWEVHERTQMEHAMPPSHINGEVLSQNLLPFSHNDPPSALSIVAFSQARERTRVGQSYMWE